MVDVLGGFVFAVAVIYVLSILVFFRLQPDFKGIGTGITIATVVTYLTRNFIWGLIQGTV